MKTKVNNEISNKIIYVFFKVDNLLKCIKYLFSDKICGEIRYDIIGRNKLIPRSKTKLKMQE